jgi:hypothetical protein
MTLQFINSLESGSIFPRSGQDSVADAESGQFCEVCKEPVEDECFAAGSAKWHPKCLKCSNCQVSLLTSSGKPAFFFDKESRKVFCGEHRGERTLLPIHHIPRLEHYNVLLFVALKRLCQLLSVPYPRMSTCLVLFSHTA